MFKCEVKARVPYCNHAKTIIGDLRALLMKWSDRVTHQFPGRTYLKRILQSQAIGVEDRVIAGIRPFQSQGHRESRHPAHTDKQLARRLTYRVILKGQAEGKAGLQRSSVRLVELLIHKLLRAVPHQALPRKAYLIQSLLGSEIELLRPR